VKRQQTSGVPVPLLPSTNAIEVLLRETTSRPGLGPS